MCCRNNLFSLLGKIKLKQQPIQELYEEFEFQQEQLHKVYQNAPNTTNHAVKKAGKAIKDNKDGTYTDEEIDNILPDSLK